jgi:hypothetical protein
MGSAGVGVPLFREILKSSEDTFFLWRVEIAKPHHVAPICRDMVRLWNLKLGIAQKFIEPGKKRARRRHQKIDEADIARLEKRRAEIRLPPLRFAMVSRVAARLISWFSHGSPVTSN